jgi:hypothetical protein
MIFIHGARCGWEWGRFDFCVAFADFTADDRGSQREGCDEPDCNKIILALFISVISANQRLDFSVLF